MLISMTDQKLESLLTRLCKQCGTTFSEARRPGAPRTLCDECQVYRRRRGSYRVTCPCGKEFTADATPGVARRYCSENHKRRYNQIIKLYGLELGAYLQMERQQGGRCAVCGQEQTMTLYIDHDHATGAVRGLLCSGCNFGLGHFGDSPERLELAAAYIRRAASAVGAGKSVGG